MRRRLLFWLLSTVLVAGLVATAVVFYQARQQANELFDYQLRQLAMMLRDRISSQLPRRFRRGPGLRAPGLGA